MPADYESTARALSLPVTEPDELESPLFAGIRPPWSHSPISRRASLPLSTREAVSFRDRAINQAHSAYRGVLKRWDKMSVIQKIIAVLAALLLAGLGVGTMILAGQIFVWLGPKAEKWERSPLAYIILWISVILVSFPPMVGWTTIGTVAGFLFGFWKGWLVFATSTVVGSTLGFIGSRTILSKYVNRLMENDKRFAALALTLKYDGLKLLCMIRLCPLPYSICNGAMSTFPTVTPLNYGLATAIITPKLMVAAFIGSRLRELSENNEEMSAGAKAVNVISIFVSITVAVGTGFYIYQRTLARAKQLEAEERAGIRQSVQADHAVRRPHGSFSDDPEANAAATTIARDEDEQLGFHDLDEDNVDLVVEGDDDGGPHRGASYRDEFTDNDSDVFEDGDGDDAEIYGLHSHVRG